jgi:hypothetical protein
MNKPFLLFTLKSAVILYFAACTSIDHYTVAKSAMPVVTKGVWKIDLYSNANNDQTNDFTGYTLTFASSGILKASKKGMETEGSWFEDNISKRISIDLGLTDPSLKKLNTNWNIREINDTQLDLQNCSNTATAKLKITIL